MPSILSMRYFWCGSHTALAYSRCGLTSERYAVSYTLPSSLLSSLLHHAHFLTDSQSACRNCLTTPNIPPLRPYSNPSYPPPFTHSGWSGCLGTHPSPVMSERMLSFETFTWGRLCHYPTSLFLILSSHC